MHKSKTLNLDYAERRMQEMTNGEMEDHTLLEELTLAMEEVRLALEEINENEKDMKQLVQLAQYLSEGCVTF